MPNVATVLKAEIVRVARKEVRTEAASLRKANAQQRSAIAALRRQVDAMQKKLRQVDSRATAQAAAVGEEASENQSRQRRFSPTRFAAHRAKTGLSALTYGKLLGIGGQTIYNWEQGKARPSAQQIQQLAEMRELGRRALLDRLGVPSASLAIPSMAVVFRCVNAGYGLLRRH